MAVPHIDTSAVYRVEKVKLDSDVFKSGRGKALVC